MGKLATVPYGPTAVKRRCAIFLLSALFAGTLMTAAPSTYRQSALRLRDAEPPGFVADPTGFLLHVLDGPNCVTHSVTASHAAAVRAL